MFFQRKIKLFLEILEFTFLKSLLSFSPYSVSTVLMLVDLTPFVGIFQLTKRSVLYRFYFIHASPTNMGTRIQH